MARTKTSFINVKVDDKGTKIRVIAEHCDFTEMSLETLRKLAEDMWKQFMYSAVRCNVNRKVNYEHETQ